MKKVILLMLLVGLTIMGCSNGVSSGEGSGSELSGTSGGSGGGSSGGGTSQGGGSGSGGSGGTSGNDINQNTYCLKIKLQNKLPSNDKYDFTTKLELILADDNQSFSEGSYNQVVDVISEPNATPIEIVFSNIPKKNMNAYFTVYGYNKSTQNEKAIAVTEFSRSVKIPDSYYFKYGEAVSDSFDLILFIGGHTHCYDLGTLQYYNANK